MSEQVKWMQCYMYNLNYIKYTSYELYPEYYTLHIDKFITYLDTLCNLPLDMQNFMRDLQSFLPLIINLDTRQWERLDITSDKVEDYSLWELNIKEKNIFNKKEEKPRVMQGYKYFNRGTEVKGRDEGYKTFFNKLWNGVKNKK
jgi:hypothetical protein